MPAAATRRDHSLGLLRDGYTHWSTVREEQGREIVQGWLLHEEVTVVRGPDAARFFYEVQDVERSSALPTALVGPLFGDGPVHMLDGPAHRRRKALFTSVLDPEGIDEVRRTLGQRWDEAAAAWHGPVDLFTEASQVLLRSACAWVGVPDPGDDLPSVARDMLAMVDGFGAPGPRQLRARRARRRTDARFEAVVRAARSSGEVPDRALGAVVTHVDESGERLSDHTAAVELINLVRPTVAVSWMVSGLALAFDTYPEVRRAVLDGTVAPMAVAQEVRRFHPFVPFLAERATRDLVHDGVEIAAGSLVVLDVWGTDNDPHVWHDPRTFDPSRFARTPVTPYNLVPQGGGDQHTGHRCPGEDLTLVLLMELVPRLAALDLRVLGPRPHLRRMPPPPTLRVAPRHGSRDR